MHRFIATVAAGILAVALAGCPHNEYVIEITPQGDVYQRKLTCWHVEDGQPQKTSALPAEQLARIGKLYPSREGPDAAGKCVFSGRFSQRTPADVGGAGWYSHLVSPLGTASAYSERFRGSDNLEAELAKRRAAADELTEIVLGWLRSELGSQPNFPQLEKFVREDLRQDLKNLGVYLWTGDAVAAAAGKASAEFLVRAGQHFSERGYLAPDDVPALARGVLAGDPARLVAHFQRLVAGKMGVAPGEPIPGCLAFLSDPQRAQQSLQKYVRTTEAFKTRIARWEEEKKTNPQTPQPTPEAVVGDLLGDAVLNFTAPSDPDTVEVKLFCGQQPFQSNGNWDQKTAAISWSAAMGQHPALPVVCFAFWSTPDIKAQEAHFGKVVLAGEQLGQYVLWYRGLTPEEALEWEQNLIARCKPGADLIPLIESFRFSRDPKPDPNQPDVKPASLADTPRQLILQGLQAKPR